MPLGLAVAAVTAMLALAIGELAGDVVDAGRARTAADAAALAATTGGAAAAERLASVNHGVVVAFERSGGTVTVTVRVGEAEATARATLDDDP
ncbi:MAG: hypothetical protein ACK5OX_05175 [Desertimonas sp.]